MSNLYQAPQYLENHFIELGYEKALVWFIIWGDRLVYNEIGDFKEKLIQDKYWFSILKNNIEGKYNLSKRKLYRIIKELSISKEFEYKVEEERIDIRFLEDIKKIGIESQLVQKKTITDFFDKEIVINFINSIDIKTMEVSSIYTETLDKDHDCIYFLFNETKLVYIGQTSSSKSRLKTHLIDKNFDGYFILKYPFREKNFDHNKAKNFIEYSLIEKFNPKYNKRRIDYQN